MKLFVMFLQILLKNYPEKLANFKIYYIYIICSPVQLIYIPTDLTDSDHVVQHHPTAHLLHSIYYISLVTFYFISFIRRAYGFPQHKYHWHFPPMQGLMEGNVSLTIYPYISIPPTTVLASILQYHDTHAFYPPTSNHQRMFSIPI